MANEEQVDLLKQGVEQWNTWREQNQEIQPDLRGADLSGLDLRGADLRGADLSKAIFWHAKLGGSTNFSEANLSGAELGWAVLGDTDFSFANLSQANFFCTKAIDPTHFTGANLAGVRLFMADLSGADLSGADLTSARLIGTNLDRANLSNVRLNDAHLFAVNLDNANLSEADLSGASVEAVVFGNLDLHTTFGLEAVHHKGPSTVGINTIERSQGNIPEIFLRGVGLSDTFIEYARSLIGHSIDYYTCFISYSSKNDALAGRLHADLQARGVRCWFAPEDMKIGDKTRSRIDEAIHLYEKLLLLLSEHAIASAWVESEVEAALEKEKLQQRAILFPVRLDESVMQTTQAWAAKLRRTRHIGDFTHWTDPQAYRQAFERLLRDLKKADELQNQETKQ